MSDDWKARMESANTKWLAKQGEKYPFRHDIPLTRGDGALSRANDLNVRFAHCTLPISGLKVFAFASEEDREKFKKAMGEE